MYGNTTTIQTYIISDVCQSAFGVLECLSEIPVATNPNRIVRSN